MAKKIQTQDALVQMGKRLDKYSVRVPRIDYSPQVPNPPEGDEEVMIVVVSDLQIGHRTKTTNIRRVRARGVNLAKSVIRIADLHRGMYPIRKLVIVLNGDYVQGLPPFFMNVAEMEMSLFKQVYDHAIPILANLIVAWAHEFEEIEVVCVPGNHGRQGGKMGDDEFNVDTIIHMTLQSMFTDNPNIKWFIDSEQFYMVHKVFRTKMLAYHGQGIKMSLSIPWYGIIQRLMRWQGAIEPFDVFILGHFHVANFLTWNDSQIVMNGSWVSDDAWVMQNLGMNSIPTQVCFGVHPKRGITWRYILNLDR
jgi:hypothetical protein